MVKSLIVKSFVRKIAGNKRVSVGFYNALEKKVEDIIKDATKRADGNKRSTLMAHDIWFSKIFFLKAKSLLNKVKWAKGITYEKWGRV